MLVAIALIFLVLWVLGLVAFKTAGKVIHVLLVIALILFVVHYV
jgi:hypothetical protein